MDTALENDIKLDDNILKLQEEIAKAEKVRKDGTISAKRGRLIRAIKAEIKKIKSNSNLSDLDKSTLDKLQELLESELDNHKEHLNLTYKEDFLKEKATIGAIFTVLPRGVGIQAKKVINCINELKEAKSNKERIFGVVELAKSVGLLAATPVIFTVKFVVRHWYLLLLLLLLLFNLDDLFGKFKLNDKDKGKNNNLEAEKEPAYAYSEVPETNLALNPNLGILPVPGEEDEKELIPSPVPQPVPVLKPSLNPGVQFITPDAANGEEELVPDVVPHPVPKPGLNPEFQFVTPEAAEGEELESTVEVVDPVVSVVPEVVLTEEQSALAKQISDSFIVDLEEKFGFFVAERHPDVIVVNSAQEYYDAVLQIAGRVPFTVDEAQFYYERINIGLRNMDQSIIWPALEERCFTTNEELVQYIASGQDEYLTEYANSYVADLAKNVNLSNEGVNWNLSDIESLCETLNISLTSGLTIFVLYELLQYGLAIPTGGASLLLPG